MATLGYRIESIVGDITTDTDMNDWLTAGAKSLVDLIPIMKAERFSTTLTDSGSGVDISGHRFIRAHKSNYEAPLVTGSKIAQIADSDSLFYATTDSPAAYVTGGMLYVIPSGGTGVAIPYPDVLFSDAEITNFPDELLQAIVFYAAIQAQLQKIKTLESTINSLSLTAPVINPQDVSDLNLGSLTVPVSDTIVGTFSISTSDFSEALNVPVFTTVNLPDVTIDTPNLISLGTSPSYSVTLPTAPTFVINTGTAPTVPAFTNIDTDIAHTDVTTLNAVANSVIDLATQFTSLTDGTTGYIDGVEDIELASAKISEIRARIEEFQAESTLSLTTALENAKAGNDVSKFNEVQTLTANIQNYQLLLQKYTSNISEWQNEMLSQYRQHQLNLESYTKDAQYQLFDGLNSFNADAKVYDATLQKNIAQAQVDIQRLTEQARLDLSTAEKEAALTLQNEIADYQGQTQRIQQKFAEYAKKVENEVTTYANKIAEFQTEVEEYRLSVEKLVLPFQNHLQRYSAEIGEYQAQTAKEVQYFSNQVQQSLSELETLKMSLTSLEAQYQKELKLHLGV